MEITDVRELHNGFIRVQEVTAYVESEDGVESTLITREVHDHGNVSAVLAVDPKRETILLVEQHRVPTLMNGHTGRIAEVIAGMIDGDESPDMAATREMIEETGFEPKSMKLLDDFFTSPGVMTERIYLYLAEFDLESERLEGYSQEDEDIKLSFLSFEQAKNLLETHQIKDAKTIIALSHFFKGE